MRRSDFLMALLICLALAPGASAGEVTAPTKKLLFDSGKEGYPRYRIPALLITPKGTLLAFCEGRKDGGGLTGNIDLVLKRGTDHGKTWGLLQVIADDDANTLGNPCPVVDRSTGTIWLAFTRSPGSVTEKQIVEGTAKETTRVFITKSTDDGLTWAKPVDITTTTKRTDWTWYGTGPGIGIQLRSGRLLIPAYHAVADSGAYRSHVIYSDDHGKTWRLGGVVGDNTSECQVMQRSDGSLYLNARTVRGTELRTIATSSDDGKTWTKPTFEKQLYDPHCQASLLLLSQKNRWLFCGPAGPGRRNLTIRTSHNQGQTWSAGKRLHSGDSQYSSMAQLGDRNIGCLFESWQNGNYRIYFSQIELASHLRKK